ncbi:MAG: Diacylglycerol kinase [Candidatus Uhrbacteria bacterium GW2011_GWD2_52_7]|uniref:Diacylglycerol kinase n=1 Tax=Candidatus Uhrbacteria bacterium GW2011_GWD2_52_7 TaxID=1618989 RepID=A0A0G2A7J8_9BACT|nr:MAG: Diacylglycerol kinase [Candidatus Uhrbacteria bacterium GW2011_GWD2_52_7]
MISFTTFGRSFRHAIRGLGDIARAEQSFRLQLIVALLILVLTFFVDLDQWEKILLILLVAAVLVLEIVNTILERIADAVEPRVSPMVREIKDMMAGAVLITALTSALVGFMILGPHILTIFDELRETVWYTFGNF